MAAATLTCKQCGHVNEAERVYCHNCGTKLDRSLLPAEPQPLAATPVQERRRIQKLTTPRRGFFANSGRSLFYAIFWALVVAALWLIARAPDGVPPMATKDEAADASQLLAMIEEATHAPAPRELRIPEDLINKYLQATVKAQPSGLLGDSLRFDRAFVNVSEGACRITLQHSLFGYPIYMSTVNQAAVANNHFVATNIGGAIGRLPIHPKLMEYSDFIFDKLWDALKRERALMDKMQSVKLHPGQVIADTKPDFRR